MDPWKRFKCILLALFVCRGVMLLCVFPPFEGCDEYQHLAYIVHLLETGEPPVWGPAVVPESLVAALASFPHPAPAVQQIGCPGIVDYARFWTAPSPPAFQPPDQPLFLYEAQHGSFYYRLAALLFQAAGGLARLKTSLAVLRLVNVLLLAGALWLALGVLERLCRQPLHAAWLGLLMALHPFFLLTGARVANDALGLFLGTAVIAQCLTLSAERWRSGACVLGLVLGLACLAKAVNLALVPVVAVAGFGLAWRKSLSAGQAVQWLLLVGAAFLTLMGPAFWLNLKSYGLLNSMQEAIVNHLTGRGLGDRLNALTTIRWRPHLINLWTSSSLWCGGWTALPACHLAAEGYRWLVELALAGFLVARLCRGFRPQPIGAWPLGICALVCLSFTVGLAFHMVESKLAWGAPSTQASYEAAAFPWLVVLIYAGHLAWPLPRVPFLGPCLLAAVFLLAEVEGTFHRMVPTYAGEPLSLDALRRLASLQPAWLGTPTLIASTGGFLLLAGLALGKVLRQSAAFVKLHRLAPVVNGLQTCRVP